MEPLYRSSTAAARHLGGVRSPAFCLQDAALWCRRVCFGICGSKVSGSAPCALRRLADLADPGLGERGACPRPMVLLRFRLVHGGGFLLRLYSKPLCGGAPRVPVAALVELFRRLVRWWCSATGSKIGGHGGPGGLLCNFFICQGSLCSLVGSAVLSVSFAYVPVCVRVYVRFSYILIYTLIKKTRT